MQPPLAPGDNFAQLRAAGPAARLACPRGEPDGPCAPGSARPAPELRLLERWAAAAPHHPTRSTALGSI